LIRLQFILFRLAGLPGKILLLHCKNLQFSPIEPKLDNPTHHFRTDYVSKWNNFRKMLAFS